MTRKAVFDYSAAIAQDNAREEKPIQIYELSPKYSSSDDDGFRIQLHQVKEVNDSESSPPF